MFYYLVLIEYEIFNNESLKIRIEQLNKILLLYKTIVSHKSFLGGLPLWLQTLNRPIG